MATTTQLFSTRLRIKDPMGFIAFVEVAATSNLPAAPQSQTAYLVTANGNYYSTTVTAGAIETDYSIEDLRISDVALGLLIDTYGEDSATCRALSSIKQTIVNEMLYLRKNTTGADTTEYQDLKTILAVYNDLIADCKEIKKSNENNNSGRWTTTKQPTIGGGNL
jgi:hypothetical protein